MIDLRSDTVTRPSAEMRRAMANADVGDDVFREDPTVNALEAMMADVLGKEAALFVLSGTMANQLAIRCQTAPGDAIVLDHSAHPFRFEAGGPAVLSGVTVCPVAGQRGVIRPADVASWLTPADNPHFTPVRLVALENTHNLSGGAVLPQNAVVELGAFCAERGLRLHLDGARLCNASAANGVELRELCAPADSVSLCFSKGLGAPAGSILAGSREMIALARRMRKMLGGGWRQAGILAAGARYAFEHNRGRLTDDHRHARELAEGIAGLDGPLHPRLPIESNIVLVDAGDQKAAAIVSALDASGVRCLAIPPNTIRLVTHLEIDDAAIRTTLAALAAATTTPVHAVRGESV
ncbi:MAG: aminotransferase class I/II-fold pyridoxal phosphate-dependent enzyme [Myxococcales bacterium]|nr:aminotransferase class I/II-fold pyridoxal phosphate-dependent enzyme [Myxococcales bacterium]